MTDSKFLGWYMGFISYDTGVVHTLSYLFSVALDLFYCRFMGENCQAFQLSKVLIYSSSSPESQLFYVASLHPTSVEKVPGKEFELLGAPNELFCIQIAILQ